MCSAGSRLLVQETVADRLIEKLKERMKHLRVGTSLDKCVDIGAIVDESQRKSIDEYVQEAKKEGAEVLKLILISFIEIFFFLTRKNNVEVSKIYFTIKDNFINVNYKNNTVM